MALLGHTASIVTFTQTTSDLGVTTVFSSVSSTNPGVILSFQDLNEEDPLNCFIFHWSPLPNSYPQRQQI